MMRGQQFFRAAVHNFIEVIEKFQGRPDTAVACITPQTMESFVVEDEMESHDNLTAIQSFKRVVYKVLKIKGMDLMSEKIDRKDLKSEVTRIVDTGQAIIVHSISVDYEISKDNFEKVIDDMTLNMAVYCTDECYQTFRNQIAEEVRRGLELCHKKSYSKDLSVLSIGEHHALVNCYTLKIHKTTTGFFVQVPQTLAKYTSFLLRMETVELRKCLKLIRDEFQQ